MTLRRPLHDIFPIRNIPPCGTLRHFVGPDGVYSARLLCRQLKCKRCHEKRVEDKLKDIRRTMGSVVYVTDKPDSYVNSSDEYGPKWWCIKYPNGGSLIMSATSFEGSVPKNLDKLINTSVNKALSDWKAGQGHQISNSKQIKEILKMEKRKKHINYAEIKGDHCDEYIELNRDIDRAIWLKDNSAEITITKAGHNFIDNQLKSLDDDTNPIDHRGLCMKNDQTRSEQWQETIPIS